MTETVIVAILALIGTLAGSFGGIVTANKLTNFRIEQLEKKVEKHNNVIERVFKLETKEEELEQKVEHLQGFHEH
jgi:cell division protein FtsB